LQSKIIQIIAILAVISSGFFFFLLTDFSSSYQSPNNEKTSAESTINSYVKEYTLPHGTWPNGILVDKNGSVWVTGSQIHKLFKFDPKQEKIVETFQLGTQDEHSGVSRMVWTMVEDNEDMIWFSQMSPDPIWRFDPHTNKSDILHVSAAPFQMKTDNAGNIWFTTLTSNTVGIIQKAYLQEQNQEYKITEFDLDSASLPSGIFFEEEYVWITMINDSKIVKFFPVKDANGSIIDIKKVVEVPNTEENLVYSPTDMIILGDSSVWVTEHGTSFVSKFSDDFQSVIKFPTSQNQYQATSLPFWIKGTKDGKGFWFNEHTGNKIGFFDAEKMELIEYEIPSRPSDGYIVFPLTIATDPTNDNLLWFSEWNTDKIGVVDKSIPIPFDLVPEKDEIVFLQNNNEKSANARITVNIIKNQSFFEENVHNIIWINASSTLELNAGLGDMHVNFSTNHIDLTKINEKEQVDILLQNITEKGNHTLSISATNGIITKSIFFNLIR
jgi:streptogramin lyase